MPQLYEEVTLVRDFPEYNLKQGDCAILVDIVPHPSEGEEGYILEIFDATGESINVVIVPQSAIKEEENPSEIPNTPSSPQVIMHFHEKVQTVAGIVEGNQVNQGDKKE